MSNRQYSRYQQGVIKRYYDHQDTILLGRLQELVTELYLTVSESKKEKLWQRAEDAMARLKVPKKLIEHIIGKKDPSILAMNLEDWLKNPKSPPKDRQERQKNGQA